jgi:FkbM family methyltransferase
MSGRAAHGMANSVFSAVWAGVSTLFWSPRFVRTVGAVLALLPSVGDHRIAYKGTYMYATSVDRWVALLAWKYGILEAYELQIARSLIRPGMHILDVGSNVGFHSLEFARWTGTSGTVDAFEPAPENYAVLKRNVEASGLDNVRTFQVAISDHVGETTMYLSPAHRGDHRIVAPTERRASIHVRTTTLDARYATPGQRVDFVKIDVQGAEYLVLAGMREIFRSNPDIVVLVEFSPELVAHSGHSSEEFVALVASLERRIHIIDQRAKQCVECDLDTLRRKADTARQLDLLLTRL